MSDWIERLEAIGACCEAIDWCKTQSDKQTAWENCGRGYWMLWLLWRVSPDKLGAMREQLIAVADELSQKDVDVSVAVNEIAIVKAAYDAVEDELYAANIVRKHVPEYPA